MTLKEVNNQIAVELEELKKFLILKNTVYGNSLHDGVNIFQPEPLQGLLGRIDDKLSRIKSVGLNEDTEDTITDLMGYLVHLKIMLANNKEE
ncbi:MAG: hypothetical protein LBM02_09870 [Lachnospiraceae bacterium]|jgi:hypothetical protein|nr:hypothetical protein [Lachnospiraceae bacterium]